MFRVRALQVISVINLVAGFAACSSDDGWDEDTVGEEDADDSAQLAELADLSKTDGSTWTSIGLGVVYQRVNAGDGVLIAYGGYTARLAHSASWATELVNARLGAAGVGHIYAVRGPWRADYSSREIANSKLRAHLAQLATTAPVYAVAHSSGSYVAHELLEQLDRNGDRETMARLHYANLDGGGVGLTATIVGELAGTAFVYANDPTLARGRSQNNATAISLATTYRDHASLFEVSVPDTGCNSGAGWCLHDVVITHRPHLPTSYDLANDYTDFVDRPVTTEYLSLFVP